MPAHSPKRPSCSAALARTITRRSSRKPHIFPALRKAGGPAAGYVDVLIAQHNRGREITDYILAVAGRGAVGTGDAEPLARVFETFVLMYQNHTAREDTISLPGLEGRPIGAAAAMRSATSSKTLSANSSARTGLRMP